MQVKCDFTNSELAKKHVVQAILTSHGQQVGKLVFEVEFYLPSVYWAAGEVFEEQARIYLDAAKRHFWSSPPTLQHSILDIAEVAARNDGTELKWEIISQRSTD